MNKIEGLPQSILPGGTVTFLFTDIEGSTQLLKQLRDRYAELLAHHHQIIREAIEQCHGREVDTQGDAFFAAFPKATEAVAAVIDIQRNMTNHEWPEGARVRVRMGLHTGEPWLVQEGYVGMDVHRAARIGHVGSGDQVLLSETTTALVRDELPEGVSLLDLGRHRLKDMRRPEHIHQLVIEGLPSEFPPLKSLEVIAPTLAAPEAFPGREARQVGSSPYRGLAAFRECDAELFFGREAFTNQLSQAVQERGLVAVIVGPSGSGKSSTVFAGLLPQLRDDTRWLIVETRPGSRPFYTLAGALMPTLADGLGETELMVETKRLAQAVRDGELSLFQVVNRALERHPDAQRMLLVIDQFEELFTLRPDPEAQRLYLDELLAAAETGATHRRSPLVLLLTLRADFMGQALTHREFADALQEGALILGPMNRQELQAAVEKPADLQGAAFEAGLVQRILDDIGQEPGNLPLLEFALTLLWERMDGGWMTHTAYEEIGRVDGALARYADEVFEDLDEDEKEGARRLFVQLVQPGEGTEDTRRVARRGELTGEIWPLVQYLADRRLVVTGRDQAGDETVEVVHEALIRSWERLRGWMQEDRAFRTWQEGLRAALRGWETSNQDRGALLRGAPLAMALEWAGDHQEQLSQAELDYIEAGRQERERRLAKEEARRQRELETAQRLAETEHARAEEQAEAAGRLRRRAIFLTGAVVVVILLAVTAGALMILANNQRARAEASEQEALRQASIGLAAQALAQLDTEYPERGILLALETLENYPYTAQAESALAQTIYETLFSRSMRAPDVAMYMSQFSPDGTRIATVGYENTITIFDSQNLDILSRFNIPESLQSGEQEELVGVDWLSDGRILLTASRTYDMARVWDANIGKELLRYEGHDGPVNNIYVGDDDRYALTSSDDSTAHIWDISTGETMLVLSSHEGPVNDAIWSPDNEMIATISSDGSIRFWDAQSGEQLSRIHNAHLGGGTALSWSGDGKQLASAGLDGMVRIWQVDTGELLLNLIGHDGPIGDIEWSPDNLYLATASDDATARVWDARTGAERFQLGGQAAQLAVDWSLDGKQLLVTAAFVTRLWDLKTPILKLIGHGDELFGHVQTNRPFWLPGNQKVVTGGASENAVRVWDALTGENIETITDVPDMGFTLKPGGTELLLSNPTRIRNLETEEEHPFPTPLGFEAIMPVWSDDGSLLVVTDFTNENFVIYDVETQQEIFSGKRQCSFNVFGPNPSPDNRFTAQPCFSGENTSVLITELATGDAVIQLDGHEDAPIQANWSPDGTRLASTSADTTIRVWDVASGETLTVFTSHPDMVFDAKWSPDGSRIASTDVSGNVIIWDVETGQEVNRFQLEGPVLTVRWSSDGQQLLSTGLFDSPDVRPVWQSTEDLVEYAKACCVNRELTPEEREQFGLTPE